MITHRKILKPREMVSGSTLAYLHIRWNDLPFWLVEKISQKIWKQGKSVNSENAQIQIQEFLSVLYFLELANTEI